MAPKKAPAAPKRTIDEVNEEFSAKQAASAARMEELKKALALAKRDCDSARLDLVATRENRVYFSAKVAAMSTANEAFDESCKHEVETIKHAVRQVKRTGKDKGYEVNYVRDVASGVEREKDLVLTSIAQVETDARTDPRELERELDRLAFMVGGLTADRPRLQRTSAALLVAKERINQVAPRRVVNAAPSPLQLTIIGGSGSHHVHARSVYSCGEVLQRVEDALVQRCGFEVIERILPDLGTWTRREAHSAQLQRRVTDALTHATAAPHSALDVTAQSIVIIHCPSVLRRVTMADGSAGPQVEVVLLLSQISDDAKAFLASTAAGSSVDWRNAGTAELPLNVVIAVTLAHNTKHKHVTLVVDTWAAASDEFEPVALALYWHSACMTFPLLYEYSSPHESATVDRSHRLGTHLSPLQRAPRGCMLECLGGIIEGTNAAHVLDAVSTGRALEATLHRRFDRVLTRVEKPTGHFATLALRPRELRTIHHCMPLHVRPLPSPQPLHVECRQEVPDLAQFWLRNEALPSEFKWCRRGTAGGRSLRAPTGQNALLRSYAEESSAVPHVRFLVDVAVEDPRYHQPYEDVEDLDASKVMSLHAADDVNMSLDISQVEASPAKGGFDASSTSMATSKQETAPASARPGAVTCRRAKRLVDDETEWSDLIGRRLRQALLAVDEDARFIRQVAQRSGCGPFVQQVLPEGLVEPVGPIPFTVRCKPLDRTTHDALSAVVDSLEWFVEGKRCPERTVSVEMLVALDVKAAIEGATSPDASSRLAASINGALAGLCGALDASRPEGTFVQIAHHVETHQRGGPRDDTHFVATIQLAGVLTEQILREQPQDQAFTAAKHWLRATLTNSLGRWNVNDGREWIQCSHGNVCRATRVFHVQRNWECGLRLAHGGRGVPPLHEAQLEKHIGWIQHLVRLVQIQGGFAGGGTSDSTHSPAGSDHRGPDTCVRLLEVKSIPSFIGVQRRALVHGHQAPGDDALGPGSSLNRLTELELSVALRVISQKPTRPALTMSQADALETTLLTSFTPHRTPTTDAVGVVLLTWLVPQSFLRVVQRTPPHLHDEETTSVAELQYLVKSLVEQFHMQHRLAATDPNHPKLFVSATTSFAYEDEHPRGSAIVPLAQLLHPSEAPVEPRTANNATTSNAAVALDVAQVEASEPTDALPEAATTPHEADEQRLNEDQSADAPAAIEEPAATISDAPTEIQVVQPPVPELPADQEQRDATPVPGSLDPSATGGSGSLRSQYVHAKNPLASLFPLTPRFWDEVQAHESHVISLGHQCTLPAKVALVATTWPCGVEQSGQPIVKLLTLHTAARPQAALSQSITNTSFGNATVDDRLALRSRIVDAFLQSCVDQQ